MKLIKILLLLLFICLFLPKNGYTQWILKATGIGGGMGVAALGDKIAMSAFHKTTNGGDNWFTLPWDKEGIASISIVDTIKIWIATMEPGKIYSTTNDGLNWDLQFYDSSKTNFINYIKMFNENNGIAMGDAPANNKPLLILRTSDGGSNWISMNDSFFMGGYSRHFWKFISFVNTTTGYMHPYFPGQTQSLIYKTTDGGRTWNASTFVFPIVWSVKFYNENIGAVLSYDYSNPPRIHRTTDGGLTWASFNLPPYLSMPRDFEFIPGSPQKIWYTDFEKLYFSSNMGENWEEQFISHGGLQAQHITFGDSRNGWLFCRNGRVYKTSNGDRITSVGDGQALKPASFALYQNYPNPFNPETNIKFQIPSTNHVTLIIYNILGREVATLVNEEKPAGIYEITFNADLYNLTSSVYFYRLTSGNFSETKKLILLR